MDPPNRSRKHNLLVILLVDDDADCRGLIRDIVDRDFPGNVVYEVGSGEEALDFLYRKRTHADAPRPNLIFMDIQMPGMSGQHVLRTIKTDPELMETPVVMLSGVDNAAAKFEAAVNGANSYVLKSGDTATFVQAVGRSVNYWLGVDQLPWLHAQPVGLGLRSV